MGEEREGAEIPEYDDHWDPELQAELHIGVMDGLEIADLFPLARFLRSPFDIPDDLRQMVADAIEGASSVCQIAARRKRPGKPAKGAGSKIAKSGVIEAFFESRNACGGYEAAITETRAQFALSRSAVTNAISLAKKHRENLPDAQKIFWDRGRQRRLARLLDEDRHGPSENDVE